MAVAAALEPITPTALTAWGYFDLSHLNGPVASPPVDGRLANGMSVMAMAAQSWTA